MNCADSHISQEKMSNALSYLSLTGWSCRQFGSVILADRAIDTFDEIDELDELMFKSVMMEDMAVFDVDLNMIDHPGECDIVYLKCGDKDRNVMMVRESDNDGKEWIYITDFLGHSICLNDYMQDFEKDGKHYRYITGDMDTVFADDNHYIVIDLIPVCQDVTNHDDMKRHVLIDTDQFKVLYSPMDYIGETFETTKYNQDNGIEVPEEYYFIELNDCINTGEFVKIADELYRDDFNKIRIGVVFTGGKYLEISKETREVVKNQTYSNFNALMNELRPVVYNYTKNKNDMSLDALKQSFEHAGYIDKMMNIYKFTGDMQPVTIKGNDYDKTSSVRAINGLVQITVKNKLSSSSGRLFINRIFNESGDEIKIQGDKPSTHKSSYELLEGIDDAEEFKEARSTASSLAGGVVRSWEDKEKDIDVFFARTFNRFIALDAKRDDHGKLIGLSVRMDIQSGMATKFVDYYTDTSTWDIWACAITKAGDKHECNTIQCIDLRTSEEYYGTYIKTRCVTPSGKITSRFKLNSGTSLIDSVRDASGQVVDGYSVINVLRDTSDMLLLDSKNMKEIREEEIERDAKERASNMANTRVEKITKQVK